MRPHRLLRKERTRSNSGRVPVDCVVRDVRGHPSKIAESKFSPDFPRMTFPECDDAAPATPQKKCVGYGSLGIPVVEYGARFEVLITQVPVRERYRISEALVVVVPSSSTPP